MDIKGDWKKRAVCGLMVLAMALSLLPTSILAADTRSVTENAIKNGSFEEPAFHDKNSPQWPAKEVPDWDTTASDRKIEFGSRRNGKDAPQLMGDQTIPDGSQFAELNADEESTLYQYAETVGGNVYEWGLSHRGREGDDHMALIIGPKQDEKPDKPNKAGKDQFMRMTDWVKSHAEKLGVNIPVTGCTQKITVYSKKFAANGGFQNDIGDAFSASPSDVYTEKWNVWIIGTNNNAWGNYGTKSPDYAEGKLAYSCRYAVPDGQTKTVFAFCSYSAATSNKTLGNLIDNIHFSLYQTITAAATAGGSGFIGVPTGGKNVYYEIRGSMSELVVANGSPITVKAVEPESDDVQFVGAYVTRQTQNGLKKEFIPATSPSWDKVDRTYTYEHPVEEPADIVLVFVKKPTVTLNGTAAKGNDTITVQEGTVYEKLNPETGTARGATAVPRQGSVFAGWYDAQGKHPLTDKTTYTPEKGSSGRYQDGSYVARFRLKQYVLHYDANGGTDTMEDQTFPHGQAHPLEKCAFSREGYRFVGWATESAGEVKYEDQKSIKLDEEFKNLTNDNDVVTLYAVWEEQSVTIGYEPNDAELGSVSSALETVAAVTGTAKGSTAQAKSGARFDGWYSADGTLLSKELTFVPTKKDGAVWQGTTYYARFSAQRRPSTPSTPAKPDETKPTLAPIPEMLNGEDHYAYLLGYEDGTVRPNGSISRAEVATVLFRLLKDDVRMQNLTKDNAYSDVSDTAWYAAAVSTLSKMGIISGYPDGTFRPNAPITRAEFAAMIARFDETAKSADTPFTDISGHWAENAIGKAYGNGWVEGSSKTVFCPESNLTRAETATLLNRVLHRLPEKESDLLANQIVWPDNPKTFWGYLAIQEATNSHEYERKADGVYETQTAKRENRDWSKEFEQ